MHTLNVKSTLKSAIYFKVFSQNASVLSRLCPYFSGRILRMAALNSSFRKFLKRWTCSEISQFIVRNLQQETGSCFKARAVGNLKAPHAAKLNRKHKYLYSFVTKEKYGFWQRGLKGTCGFKITEPCSHYVEITCRCTYVRDHGAILGRKAQTDKPGNPSPCEDVAKPHGFSVLACQGLCALPRRVRRITVLCGFVNISISSCKDRLWRF